MFEAASNLTDGYARCCEFVKTRLQVEARKGQTHYAGLRDAFVKIRWFLYVLHLINYRMYIWPISVFSQASWPTLSCDLLIFVM